MHPAIALRAGVLLVVALLSGAMRPRQTVSTRCAKTGVEVILVGSMHYNPQSIRQAADTVTRLGQDGKLGFVCLESCPRRWEKTSRSQPRGSLMARFLLPNEMQAAQFAADDFLAPVILADQNITLTTQRMKETMVESFKDLTSLNFGPLVRDLRQAADLVISGSSQQRLSPADFFDPLLLLNTPVSLFRYPLAIVLKSPIFGLAVLALFGGTWLAGDGLEKLSVLLYPSASASDSASMSLPEMDELNPIAARLIDAAATGATVVVETLLLARTFLVALLVERNTVLARNIRTCCLDVIAARASDTPGLGGEKVVVAVLGAAHVNGVAALLEDQLLL